MVAIISGVVFGVVLGIDVKYRLQKIQKKIKI